VKCLECQQVNTENQHLVGLLYPLPICEWKRKILTQYFIIHIRRLKKKNDSITVVVSKLSKTSHFILVQSTYKDVQITPIFMREIFRLHVIPKMVIIDRDVKFTSTFWKALFTSLGAQEQFNTNYQQPIDRKTE